MLVSRQPLAGVAALANEWRLDLARATRATAGIIVPLLLAETGKIPLHVIFAAIAAQNGEESFPAPYERSSIGQPRLYQASLPPLA
jgi:hypothetical protein